MHPRARPFGAAGTRGSAGRLQARGLLFSDGHLSRSSALEPTMGFGQGTMEGVAMSNSYWQNRPTFVTGATGLLGSWLVPRLVAAGADVVCLVRDWVPQSELVRTGNLERVKAVRGDVR